MFGFVFDSSFSSNNVFIINDLFSKNVTNGAHKHVPKIGYAMFNKNFQEPQLNEGFEEIKEINFVPSFSEEDKEKEELFYLFT